MTQKLKIDLSRVLFFLILPALFFTSCKNIKTESKTEFSGLRIISLAPSITKELIYLGVEENIVGATNYCDISKDSPDLVVGSAIDINIEKILLLKPDVVFASTLTKPSNIETLKENGLQVYQLGKMSSFKNICDEFLAIGKLVEKEKVAISIIKKANQTIDSLKLSIQHRDKQSVFFQIGAKPLFAVIPNTYMEDLIIYANCENILFDLEHGTVTRESVLKRNPDVIFVATMGIVGEEEKNIWESYGDINAARNNKVFIIDSNTACTPSVIAFTETLTQMVHYIYN
ncbi:MAG: ABC transporter substrate-binding protein [Salinivirgaceae bacterium]|nr:ABC transporter substrate-binding protein [Salinivirgaceae bacterium]